MMQKHMYGTRGALLAGVVALASACSGDSPTNPSELKSSRPVSALAALTCTGDMPSKSLTCAPVSEESALRGNLIIGGQGVYVRLSADPTTVPGPNSVTITNVRIQNLMAKALGMIDPTTPSPLGVRVVFHDLGNVQPANPDGYGEFTGVHQPFYTFAGPVESGATSAARDWTLNLAPGTTTYSFSVYVAAAMWPENEYLRWTNSRPVDASTNRGVYGVSPNDLFIASTNGNVLRYDGTTFTTTNVGSAGNLNDIWGNSPNNVYAVGNFGAYQYHGTSWSTITLPAGSQTLWDVDGTSSSNVTIVGQGNNTAMVYSFDGSSWSSTPLPGKNIAYGVWLDRSSSFAVASGGAGGLWHRVGGVWLLQPVPAGTGNLFDVWGTSPSNIYAVGANNTVLHYDGTSWTRVSLPTPPTTALWSIYGTSPNNVYVVGNNNGAGTNATILRFDGTTWRSETSPSLNMNYNAVYVAAGEWFVVGSGGSVFRAVR